MCCQDIALAKKINALSPSAQEKTPIHDLHGADIIFGGHDQLYYISKGVTSWENYDLNQEVLGGEQDHGDVLVVKSGTDFRDLSDLKLDLAETAEGSVRRKVIKAITGKATASMFSILAAKIFRRETRRNDSGLQKEPALGRTPQRCSINRVFCTEGASLQECC